VHTARFWNNMHQAESRKTGKPYNLRVLGANKTQREAKPAKVTYD